MRVLWLTVLHSSSLLPEGLCSVDTIPSFSLCYKRHPPPKTETPNVEPETGNAKSLHYEAEPPPRTLAFTLLHSVLIIECEHIREEVEIFQCYISSSLHSNIFQPPNSAQPFILPNHCSKDLPASFFDAKHFYIPYFSQEFSTVFSPI